MKSFYIRLFYVSLIFWYWNILIASLWGGWLAWVLLLALCLVFTWIVFQVQSRVFVLALLAMTLLAYGRFAWVNRQFSQLPFHTEQTWTLQINGKECEAKTYGFSCVFSSPWGKLVYRTRAPVAIQAGFLYQLQARLEPVKQKYSWGMGRVAELKKIQFQNLGPAKQSIFMQVQLWVQTRVHQVLSPSASGLALGLMYGDTRYFPLYDQDAFQKASLTHLVAISGYNMALLVSFVWAVFSFLRVPYRVGIALAFIAVFGAFVGFQSAVLRACMMAILVLISVLFGRGSKSFPLLLCAGFLMSFVNPYRLLYDLGFQLSFMACFGLLFKLPFIPSKASAWRDFFMTPIYATLYTAPVTLYHFGTWYPWGILANLLAGPLASLAMFASFACVLVPKFFSNIAEFCLGGLVAIAHFFAERPYAILHIESSKLFAWSLLFTLIFLLGFSYRREALIFLSPFFYKKVAKG